MNEILVTYDPRTERVRRIERAFNNRVARRSIARFATPAALIGFFAVFFTVQASASHPGDGAKWLLPGLAFFVVHDLLRHLSQRRMAAAADAAPIRNRPVATLSIGPAGVNAQGTQLSWSEIIEIVRIDDATLLLILPYQALLVPDEALPDGVTPEDLRRRISKWKAA